MAWSRLGCLASVSSDSLSVQIRHLLCSQAEKKWTLSKEHTIDLSANGENQHPILQLEWSQSGVELATVDAAGRVTIINAASMALNETTVMRPATLDREDELNQVLTMYWLNVDRPVGDKEFLVQLWMSDTDHIQYATFIHASKDQGRWTYATAKRRPTGPLWSRGVVTISRRGTLALHYQRLDGRWAIASAGLRSLTSAGYLLTHAAIAPTQGLPNLFLL